MNIDSLETYIRDWRNTLESIGVTEDLDKLDANLVDEISVLRGKGLTEAEAFIIATQRIGQIHRLSRAYFTNINKLWKHLSVPPESPGSRQGIWLTMALAMMAALFSQIPYLFGGSYFEDGSETWLTLVSFWLIPSLVIYFAYRHHIGLRRILTIGFAYGLIFLFVTLFPFAGESSTRILVMLHLPFISWLMLLPLTQTQTWSTISVVHYLRFSGEVFMYAVLLGLGGATLMALTQVIFISAATIV